jgi:hypothetical protein
MSFQWPPTTGSRRRARRKFPLLAVWGGQPGRAGGPQSLYGNSTRHLRHTGRYVCADHVGAENGHQCQKATVEIQ